MTAHSEPFLHDPLAPLYLRTALPTIFVKGMNGLIAVADALFLGLCVGPEGRLVIRR